MKKYREENPVPGPKRIQDRDDGRSLGSVTSEGMDIQREPLTIDQQASKIWWSTRRSFELCRAA